DPQKLARSSEVRDRAPTVTDEARLEEARLRSFPSSPPEPEPLAAIRARLGPLDRVPRLGKKLSELTTADFDSKTAYVLGFVDGVLPLGTILDVTGLPERETLEIFDRMIAQRVVSFRPRDPRNG